MSKIFQIISQAAASGGSAVEVTGGTISQSGGYTYHTFTSTASLTVSGGDAEVEYLVEII